MLRPLTLTIMLLTLADSPAIVIRSYSAARHDRFITNGSLLVPNPNAYYDTSLYTGVGYTNNEGQFVLIGQEHILFAKHFAPPTNNTFPIHFRNISGQLFTRNVIGSTQVPNGSGGFADVIILKLSAPVPAETGITPLPYLNLASEALYNNAVLTMFGNTRRAGRGVISGFFDFSEPAANVDTTRTYATYYFPSSGDPDDAYAVGTDSGSPSFTLVNSRPALVGLHLAAGIIGGTTTRVTLDTHVPEYAPAINSLLASQGYRLIPAYPDAVTLTSEISNAPLRQAKPATLEITVANTSANTASNPRLNLIFPAGAIPTSVTAPGWITYNPAPGDYRLRSATLSGNTSVTATITYAAVPTVSEIAIQATRVSDGSASTQTTYNLPVVESFTGFTAALTLKGELDDPDLDGTGNLLEYAFGGNPATNSNLAQGGYPLAPQSSSENGLTFTYARRTDSAQRALTYETEFSGSLENNSWGTSLPPGATATASPFDPVVPGFEKVTITIPTAAPDRMFVRVKVTLAE